MSLLAAYYAAQEQELASKGQADQASAKLANEQAGQVGLDGDSRRSLQAAQAQQTGQQARQIGANADQTGANAASDRGLSDARSRNLAGQTALAPGDDASQNALRGAQTTNTQANTTSTLSDLVDTGAGVFGMPPIKQGDEKGGKIVTAAAAIHGKGGKPGPTDTVPVMMTPGEGVLNKGAMEHYGSDVLDHMNKMGLMRMGAQSEVAKAAGMKDPHALPPVGKGGKSGDDASKSPAAAKQRPMPPAHGPGPAQSLLGLPHLQHMMGT